MKYFAFLITLVLGITVLADPANPIDDDAVGIVENAVAEIENDTKQTLEDIFFGKEAYWPRQDRLFYVFVLDENVKVVSCPILRFNGNILKENKDADNREYRDLTVKKALSEKEGWFKFSIFERGKKIQKKTFFKLVEGNDKKKYIVCCDIKDKGDNQ